MGGRLAAARNGCFSSLGVYAPFGVLERQPPSAICSCCMKKRAHGWAWENEPLLIGISGLAACPVARVFLFSDAASEKHNGTRNCALCTLMA